MLWGRHSNVVATGPHHRGRVQATLKQITSRLQELGLVLNVAKATAIAFNYKIKPPPLLLQCRPVEWASSHRYLGILLDEHLTFKPQILRLRILAASRIQVMRAMTALDGGANFTVLRQYYIHAVRSVFDSAAPHLRACPDALRPLDTIQNNALRIILGAPKWTRLCNLRPENAIPAIHQRITHSAPATLPPWLDRRSELLSRT